MLVVAVVPNPVIPFLTLVLQSSSEVLDAVANKVVDLLRDLADAGVNRALLVFRKHILHFNKL